MKNLIADLSTSKAAMVAGIAFITSVIIVTLVYDFLLANFVVPGDAALSLCVWLMVKRNRLPETGRSCLAPFIWP